MATIYILRDTASDLATPAGGIFYAQLLETTGTAGSLSTGAMAAGVTVDGYAFTEPAVPGANGTSTGLFSVEVNITTGFTDVTLTVRISRVNAAGAEQNGFTFAPQTATAGLKTFSTTSPGLGVWAAGDRLRVRYDFARAAGGHGNETVSFTANTTNDEVATPWTIGAGHDRTIIDPVAVTDGSATITQAFTGQGTDLVGVTDSHTADVTSGGHTRTIIDAVGIIEAETIQTIDVTETIIDPVAIIDQTTGAISGELARTITDAVAIADQSTRTALTVQTITDPVGIADTMAQESTGQLARTIINQVSITDQTTRTVAATRVISDAFGITDTQIAAQAYIRTIVDAVGVIDASLSQLASSHARIVSDTVGVNDAAISATAMIRIVLDVVTLTDVMQQEGTGQLARTIIDPVAVIDSLTATRRAVLFDYRGSTLIGVDVR